MNDDNIQLPPYGKRARFVAVELLTAWKFMPRVLLHLITSLYAVVAILVFPFGVLALPVFVWLKDRRYAAQIRRMRAERHLSAAMERAFGGHSVH